MEAYHELLEKTGSAMPSEIGASCTKAGTVNAVDIEEVEQERAADAGKLAKVPETKTATSSD